MTDALLAGPAPAIPSRRATPRPAPWTRPAAARVGVLLVALAAATAGVLAGDAQTVSFDPGLAWLLRAMAVLKAAMALAATAGVAWRLGAPVRPAWLAGYALALAATWTGPGLIWNLAHLRLGALLLHGGLAATLVLLWRDPAVSARLGAIVDARRRALRDRAATT